MFFGNVWQKIAQILLCVCIVSTLVNCQGVTGEAGGAVGENAGSIRDRERECKATLDIFNTEMANDEDSVFNQWKENIIRVRSPWNFFSRKPSTRKLIFIKIVPICCHYTRHLATVVTYSRFIVTHG